MQKSTYNIDDLLSEDIKKIKKTKTVGAPKKAVKKDEKFMVYLTKEEMSLIEKEVKRLGVSKAALARVAILKYLS